MIKITDNPYVCNCEISWLREWVRNGKGANVVNLPKETKCKDPEGLRNTPIPDISYAALTCANVAFQAFVSETLLLVVVSIQIIVKR